MNILNTKELKTWLKNQQETRGLQTTVLKEGLTGDWELEENHAYPLHRRDNKFHRAVAIETKSIAAGSGFKPEPAGWQQFMVEMMDTKKHKNLPINGIILLAKTVVDGKVGYLVQAKTEPGAIHQKNNVFLTTTIQASFSNSQMNPGKIPLWDELTVDLNSSVPSLEDPGIFYGKHNLLILREIVQEKAEEMELPTNYTWADREAIRALQKTGEAAQFLAQVLGTFE